MKSSHLLEQVLGDTEGKLGDLFKANDGRFYSEKKKYTYSFAKSLFFTIKNNQDEKFMLLLNKTLTDGAFSEVIVAMTQYIGKEINRSDLTTNITKFLKMLDTLELNDDYKNYLIRNIFQHLYRTKELNITWATPLLTGKNDIEVSNLLINKIHSNNAIYHLNDILKSRKIISYILDSIINITINDLLTLKYNTATLEQINLKNLTIKRKLTLLKRNTVSAKKIDRYYETRKINYYFSALFSLVIKTGDVEVFDMLLASFPSLTDELFLNATIEQEINSQVSHNVISASRILIQSKFVHRYPSDVFCSLVNQDENMAVALIKRYPAMIGAISRKQEYTQDCSLDLAYKINDKPSFVNELHTINDMQHLDLLLNKLLSFKK
jgi:hypothetical protein